MSASAAQWTRLLLRNKSKLHSMGRALLLLLLFPILSVPVFGKSDTDKRGGLIGSDAPAGKRFVYNHSAGKPREMEIFFPPNH